MVRFLFYSENFIRLSRWVLRTLEGEGREKIGMGLVVKNISWIYLGVLGLWN